MIDKFSCRFINSVYEFNDYTLNELICKLAQKMDEVITQSNESFNYLDWLKGQGLSDEVIKIMIEWKEDGTLETLINENLFNGLNTKIDTNVQELNNKIDTNVQELNTKIKSNKDSILLLSTYVTPEMFGAKGDGVTDDTKPIQDAINTNKKVLLEKNYKFTEIEIKNNLEALGVLTGKVIIKKSKITFKFNKLVGNLTILADTELVQHCNIIGNEIVHSGIGLHLKSNGNGVQYNNLYINLINAGTYCVYLENIGGWVNNNYLINCGFTGNVGIGSLAVTGGGSYESMILHNIGMEHIKKWFELNNCTDFIFQNFRCIPFEAHYNNIGGELTNSRVYFDSSVSGLYYEKIICNNSSYECLRPMSNEGERIADYMSIGTNGDMRVTRSSKPQFYKKLSEMSSPFVIDYNYDYTMPYIINCDTDKYMYINFQIPKVLPSLKYVKIMLINKSTQTIDIAFDNSIKSIIAPTDEKNEYIIYLV